MKQSLRLGTVSGIPVGLNWGLLVIALIYLTSLATGFLPSAAPGSTTGAYWIVATLGVGLFFASILAHELGHSIVAQREGIQVRAITLWLLGGIAEIEKEAPSPGAELRIAAAGPAVSIALAGVFAGVGYALAVAFGSSLFATMLVWLGLVNGVLALFNLIPAAPLDGGRILAAFLWWRTGNPHLARARAALAGQAFGGIVLAVGTLMLLDGSGFWLLILGWFLMGGATAERRRAQQFEAAAHSSVAEVMAPLAAPTDGAVTVAGLLAMGAGTNNAAYPVRGIDGTVVGLVPASVLRSRDARRNAGVPASQLVVPWTSFVGARTDERLAAVVDRFREADASHALVYDPSGRQVGYVGLSQLATLTR